MPIEVTPVTSARDLEAFIAVPHRIFAGDPCYVPALELDLRARLDRKKNPFFQHAEAEYFLARENGDVVGRITAQIDHEHVRVHGEKVGYFGFFDAMDRPDVAEALLGTAESWLRGRGMAASRGPMSFYIWDEVGVLVDGFDTPPMVLMPHARPYYARLLEGAGYQKAKDVFAWRYRIGDVPPRARKAWEAMRVLPEVKLRTVDMKQFDRDIRIVMDIFNDAWRENWSFVPLTGPELEKTAQDMKMIVDRDLAIIAEVDGEPAAFGIALPNVNEAIRDLGGKLFPFGLFKLLWRLKVKGTKTARLMLLGIRRKYRGAKRYGGLSLLLYTEMNDRSRKRGYETGELSWTLEDNHPVNLGIKVMGGEVYKTYRIYEKPL